jgi:hypothetical protein
MRYCILDIHSVHMAILFQRRYSSQCRTLFESIPFLSVVWCLSPSVENFMLTPSYQNQNHVLVLSLLFLLTMP